VLAAGETKLIALLLDGSFAACRSFAIQLHRVLGCDHRGVNRCSHRRALRGVSAVLIHPVATEERTRCGSPYAHQSSASDRTEVELFKVLWLDAFKLAFKAHLPKVASLPQSLVIVFDSNAAMLGHVADTALRRKIVKTYAKIKAMIGVVSHYAARRESWESIGYQSSPGGGINERQAEVETWSDNLRRNIPELETEIEDLLAWILCSVETLNAEVEPSSF
jgi:hypothetical protein